MNGALVALMGPMTENSLWESCPVSFMSNMSTSLAIQNYAEGLVEVDTAGWAESWPKLSGRILDGLRVLLKKLRR